MARTGVRFIHVFYDVEPAEDGTVRAHDLLCGNECWCEPRCARVGRDTILVIHDPLDDLQTIDDDNRPKVAPPDDNPFRSR